MQDAITRCTGLVLQYNPLSTAPGALVQADNCVVTRENIIEDRRGYMKYLTLGNNVAALMTYQNKVIAHNGTTVSYDNSGTPASYSGTYSAPTGFRMRGSEAYQNLYVTTSKGVQVFTDTAGTVARLAGAPRSLDPSYALNAGITGFLPKGNNCAYRCVIQRTDANGNVLYGYPSTRLFVYNSDAANPKNIDLTLYLPSEVTVSDVIQFYRTQSTGVGSGDTAGDEMALVYQVSPSSTDITNGYITFTDSLTDTLRGAALYTSPSQEGISQGSDRPPLCSSMALYRNDYMIYANTSTKQRLFFSLVGTSGLTGNTITLGGVTYNFGASEIVSGAGSPQAQVGATGIAAADIDSTARSLVRVINRYAGNTTVYAYYLSGPSDVPGQIMIEEKGIGGSAFSIQGSNSTVGGMFFPPPPVSPATNSKSTSSNQVQINAIYFSKAKQPEAVPALNYLLAGSSNKKILRVVALRDSLIIIKEEGVYRMTGDTPQSFVITPLDLTVKCKAIDSVAALSNTVIMLSNQGVVQVSDTGVQVISREIEPALKPLLSMGNLSANTVAEGYESERMYILSTVTVSTDSTSNQIFTYNIFTRTWTRWTFGLNALIVEPSADILYFSKSGDVTVYKERKDFADTDYADPESTITIESVNFANNSVNFTTTSITPDVGYVISQAGTEFPIQKLVINHADYTAYFGNALPAAWAAGSATMYPPVGMAVVWDDWTGGQLNAGMIKQVSEVAILSDNVPGASSATAVVPTFKSNFDENQEEITISPSVGGWGGAWGSIPWGGIGDGYGYRTFVPRNKQFCRILNPGVKHKNARERLSIAGVALQFEVLSERIGR